MTLSPGFHRDISQSRYLKIDALGSTQLEWLYVSPLNYRYLKSQPPEESEPMSLGDALHAAILEPRRFAREFVLEPDPAEVAPGNVKPRATKAYRDAVAEIEAAGVAVLRLDAWASIQLMKTAIESHPLAAKALERAPERELAMLWDRDGRPCRGRLDAAGDRLVIDLKTTRSLRDFSPFAVTKYGYHRQAAWYVDGAHRLGRDVEHYLAIAVENSAPYDVGVFTFDAGLLSYGHDDCEELVAKLAKCERSNVWPGQFPEIQQAMLTEREVAAHADEEAA